ncbi:hypothetical protein ACETK8_07440 [Brevundimonas staleyi]|uniref:Uncharacterized protein n=1 Tax=Brevundimonas staleyi TaxID=74326 RepID=A0ABW0FQS8_9CAUL
MIAVLVFAAALQTSQASELLFSESWTCATLARMGRETHFGDTTPQTTSEQAMWDALTQLETRASEDAEQKAVGGAFNAEKREVEETYARNMIGRASGDQLGQMLDTCANAFGVVPPAE